MSWGGSICNFSFPEDEMLLHRDFLIFISSHQIRAKTIILMYYFNVFNVYSYQNNFSIAIISVCTDRKLLPCLLL